MEACQDCGMHSIATNSKLSSHLPVVLDSSKESILVREAWG